MVLQSSLQPSAIFAIAASVLSSVVVTAIAAPVVVPISWDRIKLLLLRPRRYCSRDVLIRNLQKIIYCAFSIAAAAVAGRNCCQSGAETGAEEVVFMAQ